MAVHTARRSFDPGGNDIIRDINDVRNGLYLNASALTQIGLGKFIAVLVVRLIKCDKVNWKLTASLTRHLTLLWTYY